MTGHFFFDSDIRAEILEPGKVSRKVRAHDGRLMLVEVIFATGAVGSLHEHPHEQATYCLAGEFAFSVGETTMTLRPGDSVHIPASFPHGVTCVAAGRLLDTFTPQREDFLRD
jgi:quercetin dioxygenase-like cupin family protein